MSDEIAWLIEHANSQASRPEYLGVRATNNADTQACIGQFEWFENHHDALRFARRIDAILFVGAVRELSKVVPHGKTLDGLRSGELAPRVAEHMWSDISLSSDERQNG